ncbi:uncharacterized protein LOC115875930 [Sitophilus oryzae]|uniref:Uncharacterized protein LOC115875930 n=1 Tax=Sitophilus oryzae TaxID=7048 RepID=A0A6J2X850_SITOR|nr:uncharacterized protein LOC115875930 [Sitophilus oryzae]XP_030747382.1 uncharacterized protein LOC115875930 [Sitophilus oryzae]
MSTSISTTQTATVLPKAVSSLKKSEEKPPLQRSSSIETIKRINTIICSPQTYILPAMLTTWLKTGQTGLQSSTEKTIFMFRSLLFGYLLQKFVSVWRKSGVSKSNITIQKTSAQLTAKLFESFPSFFISVAFYLVTLLLIAQIVLCVLLLNQCLLPYGMHFLFATATYIAGLGYKINCYSYSKPKKHTKLN